MRTLLDLIQAAPPGVQLASLGQRYQNYPAATFDQRFGPYETGPMSDQERLRRMYELEILRRTPEGIVPGTRTWPFGYVQT